MSSLPAKFLLFLEDGMLKIKKTNKQGLLNVIKNWRKKVYLSLTIIIFSRRRKNKSLEKIMPNGWSGMLRKLRRNNLKKLLKI